MKHLEDAVFVVVIAAFVLIGAMFLNTVKESKITAAATDTRLDPGKDVIGIRIGNVSRAYVIDEISVVNDVLSGTPVIVIGGERAAVFERRLNGFVLEFTMNEGKLIDSNGRQWNTDGTSQLGKLKSIESRTMPWYEWLSAEKGTQLYEKK